jgi:hypothetical protein
MCPISTPNTGVLMSTGSSTKIFEISNTCVLCSADSGIGIQNLVRDLRRLSVDCALPSSTLISSTLTSRHRGIGVSALASCARKLIWSEYRNAHVMVVGRDRLCGSDDDPTDADMQGNRETENDWKIYEISPGGSMIEQGCMCIIDDVSYLEAEDVLTLDHEETFSVTVTPDETRTLSTEVDIKTASNRVRRFVYNNMRRRGKSDVNSKPFIHIISSRITEKKE